jgi:hypothetical protein
MVTNILSEDPEHPSGVMIEINRNITAKIRLCDTTKLQMLKERAFETGIFISTIVAKKPSILVECETIIFGRPQAHQA